MKTFAFASVAALVATVAAQAPNLGDLPTCAQSCINLNDIGAQTGCGQFDFHCICSKNSFITSLSCCVAGKCDTADQQKTVQFAQGICKGVGVNVPTAAACSGAGASSTSAAAAGSSSASSAVTSSVPSSTSGSTMTMSGSAVSSGSMAMSSASVSSASAASAASASSASSASAPASSAAAANLMVQGAGAAGGLIAAIAALL